MRYVLMILLSSGALVELMAAEYFVDYASGSDAQSGRSVEQAWKHCPGDAQATATAAAVVLKAGDRVRFKGGVRYYGSIKVAHAGTAASPIIYDGNQDGTYGDGAAIIDGSTPITNWKQRGKDIYVAEIEYAGAWDSFVLCGDAGVYAVSMSPNPRDPLFQDRVHEFYESPEKLQSNAAVSVYAGPGTWLNKDRPIVNAVKADASSAVISPIGDATIHVALNKEHTITEVAIGMVRQHTPVKDVKITANKKHVLTVQLKPKTDAIQRFKLKQPVKASDIGFNFASAHGKPKATFTAVRYLQAFNAEGVNVLEMKPGQADGMCFSDPERFTSDNPDYYDGMTVAVHGGHNFTKHLDVTGYDPVTKQLRIESMNDTVYKTTKYALKNGLRLIDRPREFSLRNLPNGKAVVHIMPDEHGVENVSFSSRERAFHIEDKAGIQIQGFRIERFASKKGSAIDVHGSRHVTVQDCEITMTAGTAAIHGVQSEDIVLRNNNLHHLPIKTRGVRFEACTRADTIGNTIIKPTGTALSYVNTKGGRCSQNEVAEFHGMHSNGLTFYVNNHDIMIDRNYVHSGDGNVPLTIQAAVNCRIQNNVFDADGGIGIGIWVSKPFKDNVIEHNTIVNADPKSDWKTAIFSNNKGPENLIIRNNILDGIAGNLPASFSNNIYTRLIGKQRADNLETGSRLVPDISSVIDAQYKTKQGSMAVDAASPGAISEDFAGNKRPSGAAPDIGAYEVQ